jgi:hypothetical protein
MDKEELAAFILDPLEVLCKYYIFPSQQEILNVWRLKEVEERKDLTE